MKSSLLVLSFIFSQASFAAINNSSFEARHENLIETSITQNCGHFRDLNIVESKSESISIDNGITDVKFITLISGFQKLDQNIFDEYEISIESSYTDMYDHNSQNWGAYTVESVTCKMK